VKFVVESTIDCPPEEAFDKMADARNETAWNTHVSRSELVSGEPLGKGSRFTTVNRGKEYTAELATYERPDRLGFEVTGQPMDITAAFTFQPVGAGSRLAGEFDMRPKGFMKLIFPLMKPAVQKSLPREMQSFKIFCESTRV
jgi:polyketide cyclase/dehydrase/lipid transport protein